MSIEDCQSHDSKPLEEENLLIASVWFQRTKTIALTNRADDNSGSRLAT